MSSPIKITQPTRHEYNGQCLSVKGEGEEICQLTSKRRKHNKKKSIKFHAHTRLEHTRIEFWAYSPITRTLRGIPERKQSPKNLVVYKKRERKTTKDPRKNYMNVQRVLTTCNKTWHHSSKLVSLRSIDSFINYTGSNKDSKQKTRKERRKNNNKKEKRGVDGVLNKKLKIIL